MIHKRKKSVNCALLSKLKTFDVFNREKRQTIAQERKSLQITYPTEVVYPECIKNFLIPTVRNNPVRKRAKVLKRQLYQRGYMDDKYAHDKMFKIINYQGNAT